MPPDEVRRVAEGLEWLDMANAPRTGKEILILLGETIPDNANVRSAHLQAGLDYPPERAIPLDEAFIVGGEALMYPGDPAGSPGNVINCHCIQIAVAPEEEL